MTWITYDGAFIHVPKCAGHSIMRYFPGKLYQEGWLHQRRSEVKCDTAWTIVRNPIDRLVSYWLYEKRTKKTSLELEDWLVNRRPKRVNTMCWYLDGPLDKVYRFENLERDFPGLPHNNPGNTKGTQYYIWNNKAKDIIIDLYKEDFERFNYA